VNSIVEPIFNEKMAKKCNLWDSWTVHRCTVHCWLSQKVRLKQKKKKKNWKRKTQQETRIQTAPKLPSFA